MTIEIAERLVKLRKKYGYSQEELADKLGLSRQAVSKWERAEASPDTDNLICLAKLYGVSLDELLATDEDIDTIVEEQVNKEEKEENKDSETTVNKGRDRVVINDDGVIVESRKGKRVTINDDGITCYDSDGKVIKRKRKKMDKGMAVIGCIEGVLMLLAVVAFLLLGLLASLWASAWVVFFVPEICCSIARAIYKGDARKVNIPFISAFVFFFVCMFLHDTIGIPQLWNPMWVVFLAVPVYYSIVGTIYKALGKFQDEDCCGDDYDDDEDEDDEDEDEDKVVSEQKTED